VNVSSENARKLFRECEKTIKTPAIPSSMLTPEDAHDESRHCRGSRRSDTWLRQEELIAEEQEGREGKKK
jgi:hypothetical protein